MADASPTIGVLFVCYANICRSPLAEGIFRDLAARAGHGDRFVVDSAGCWADTGHPPHEGSIAAAARRGIDLGQQRSRSVVPDDLTRFDHILAMDRSNLADLERYRRLSAFGPVQGGKARIRLLRHVADPKAQGEHADVPDPFRRAAEAYEATYTIIEAGCRALLAELVAGR
jgi:protein-tyrosine phosphatase